MGILNPMHKDYVKNRISFAELNQIQSLKELEDLQSTDLKKYERLLKLLDKGVLKYEIQQLASIKYLVDFSKNTTASRLGLRTGGRTLNERPTEYNITYGADADIQSAYGGSLQSCQFPIGKPRMFVQTNNTTQILTLKQFMDKFGNI